MAIDFPKAAPHAISSVVSADGFAIPYCEQDIPEMRSLKNIDIAFVCMNLPYTMDINHAASAVLAFKPKIIYPYHYRGQNGMSDINAFKQMVDAGKQPIEVRLRNWYATQ